MLNLTENAKLVLEKRYLIKDAEGNVIETPETMYRRVATSVAEPSRKFGEDADALAETFYDLMTSGRFLPNSPTLMNAGRPLGQLSACFVLPIHDSISNGQCGIYDTLRAMALIHQSGGGTGFSFSRLRPEGSMVRSTTGVASGPVSFMRLYDMSTEVVKQGGTRRGANMAILRIDHPDIMKFITCKNDLAMMTNFNISVAITDEFMEAVSAQRPFALRDPSTGIIVAEIDAVATWELLLQSAWSTGEPGLFFIDRANAYNPVPALGQYEATNPCGEQPLLPYDTCNLGSINVAKYVQGETFSWEQFVADVHLSVRFLDNVIEANRYPLPEIEQLARRIRRIGLGIMGFADALIALGIPYDSEEALQFAERLASTLDTASKDASEQLAHDRGVFAEWSRSVWGPFEHCAKRAGERVQPERRLRNCNITTIAPTGTISIFANCSSGIEPIFAVAFMRNQAGAMMPDINGAFVAVAQKEGWYSESLMNKVLATGHAKHSEVPERWQRVFVTANEISAEYHVRMQAIFQKHIDSAISKTINFPASASVDEVRQAYELAYALGCKGITMYRDGSRAGQVLSTPQTGSPNETRDCPACGVELEDQDGCIRCTQCGYEACEILV